MHGPLNVNLDKVYDALLGNRYGIRSIDWEVDIVYEALLGK
jgi:hypothetical protein